MFAFAPAGNGGPGLHPQATLCVRARAPVVVPAVLATGAALFVALLVSGFAFPQVEWFALPERLDEMKERPREFWRHFAGLLLALVGLDAVSDVAGVVFKPVARSPGRRLCIVAVKAVMLHALLALAASSFLSDPQLGDRQVNLLPFLPADYAGQWAELAVGVIGDLLLLSVVTGAGADPVETESLAGSVGDDTPYAMGSAEATGVSGAARHDG